MIEEFDPGLLFVNALVLEVIFVYMGYKILKVLME
jgi:hypothetical protein